ncbi:MAG: hypothetical protein HC836_13935 [Richelia sp. RM2_1_2]|nr:hypothetical protein [Richelia sp. RM2_1_2]
MRCSNIYWNRAEHLGKETEVNIAISIKDSVLDSLIIDNDETNHFSLQFENTTINNLFLKGFFSEKSEFNFRRCEFSEKINFTYSNFTNPIYFVESKFHRPVSFVASTFTNSIYFNLSTFLSTLEFKDCKFKDKVSLQDINFAGDYNSSDTLFSSQNCQFEDEVDLSIGKVDNSLQEFRVSFNESIFDRRLKFHLLDDSQYDRLVLGLRMVDINSFVCEDKDITKVKLEVEYTYHKEVKDALEEVIQEKRIWRSILDNLHWGDEADQVYADIMDKQLDLKYFEQNTWWGKVRLQIWDYFIYKICFGWGVRIFNPIIAGVASVIVFALLYSTLNQNYDIPHNLEVSVRNLFFGDLDSNASGLIRLVSTIQGVWGIAYVTTLIAIISRKFMRL